MYKKKKVTVRLEDIDFNEFGEYQIRGLTQKEISDVSGGDLNWVACGTDVNVVSCSGNGRDGDHNVLSCGTPPTEGDTNWMGCEQTGPTTNYNGCGTNEIGC